MPRSATRPYSACRPRCSLVESPGCAANNSWPVTSRANRRAKARCFAVAELGRQREVNLAVQPPVGALMIVRRGPVVARRVRGPLRRVAALLRARRHRGSSRPRGSGGRRREELKPQDQARQAPRNSGRTQAPHATAHPHRHLRRTRDEGRPRAQSSSAQATRPALHWGTGQRTLRTGPSLNPFSASIAALFGAPPSIEPSSGCALGVPHQRRQPKQRPTIPIRHS